MEKILKLNVNSYWFGLLDKGEINFDYREIRPFWTKRFTTCDKNETRVYVLNRNLKQYDIVEFFIPHTQKKIRFGIKSISAYKGSDIGLDCYEGCFIVELGERILTV